MIRKGIGLERVFVGGSETSELSTEKLAENKEPKRLTLFSWRVGIRIINTNKRRKVRFTKVVKSSVSYGPEGFSSKINSTDGGFYIVCKYNDS